MDPIRGSNPFPPPPRRVVGPLVFFLMLGIAIVGAVYLGWTLIAGEEPVAVPTAPSPAAEAQSQLTTMVAQLGMFEKSVGRFPTVEEGLQALATRPDGLPPETLWLKLRKEIPLDPWGRPYEYTEQPGHPASYRVSSLGPKAEDPSDDLVVAVAPVAPATPAPGSAPFKPKFRL